MNEEDYLKLIQILISAALLWFGYFFMFKRTRADRFREDLFTIRDNLFDYMNRHGVPYGLRAHRLMRELLNGSIIVADWMNIWLVTAWWPRLRRRRKSNVDELREAINEIPDPAIRSHFAVVHDQVGQRMLSLVTLEGPQAIFFWPLRLIGGRRRRVQLLARRLTDQAADESMEVGKLEWDDPPGFSKFSLGGRGRISAPPFV